MFNNQGPWGAEGQGLGLLPGLNMDAEMMAKAIVDVAQNILVNQDQSFSDATSDRSRPTPVSPWETSSSRQTHNHPHSSRRVGAGPGLLGDRPLEGGSSRDSLNNTRAQLVTSYESATEGRHFETSSRSNLRSFEEFPRHSNSPVKSYGGSMLREERQRSRNHGRNITEKSKKNMWEKIKPETGPPNYRIEEFENLGKGMFSCHLCDKKMWNCQSFLSHLRGKAHEEILMKMVAKDTERVSKTQELIRMLEIEYNGGKAGSHKCNMCSAMVRDIMGHRKSEPHKILKDFVHPYCKLCDVDFEDRKDLLYHIFCGIHLENLARSEEITDVTATHLNSTMEKLRASIERKFKGKKRLKENPVEVLTKKVKKEAELVIVEKDADTAANRTVNRSSNSEEDKINQSGSDKSEVRLKECTDTSTVVKKEVELKLSSAKVASPKKNLFIDPSLPGSEYVKAVEGFFCSICKKFFPVGADAVTEHCNSLTHKSKTNSVKESEAAKKLRVGSGEPTPRESASKFF